MGGGVLDDWDSDNEASGLPERGQAGRPRDHQADDGG